jgi:hypothetical protein
MRPDPRHHQLVETALGGPSKKDAKSVQKLGQLQPFCSCIPTGMYGPTCIFLPNLTPFLLQSFALYERLIENAVLFGGVDPERVR